MKNIQSHLCVLCNAASRYYEVDHGNLKYFDCPSCTNYLVSWRAEEIVVVSPYESRKRWSDIARQAPSDKVLLIRLRNASERSEDPQKLLSVEIVDKSDYDL